MAKTQVSVSLDNEIIAELDAMAKDQQRSRSNMIEALIINFFAVKKAVNLEFPGWF